MTDEKLDELEAACSAKADKDGMVRIDPGDVLELVLDLREHEEAWVRERLGDRWLGFTDERLTALLGDAGFHHIKVGVGARRTGDPFTVLVASATK